MKFEFYEESLIQLREVYTPWIDYEEEYISHD